MYYTLYYIRTTVNGGQDLNYQAEDSTMMVEDAMESSEENRYYLVVGLVVSRAGCC